MAPPGRNNGRPSTAAATVADTQTGYDPHIMVWTSIPTSDSPPELPQSFKSAALTAAFARREPASNALWVASSDAASLATAAVADAEGYSSTILLSVTRSAGPQRGHKRFLWHPQPLPKPKATDFVVVLKPRTHLSLANAFPENGAGRVLIAHLGATATRLVTIVTVREQNLISVYTSHPHIADKLIGEFAVLSPAGPVHLFGYVFYDALLILVQPYKKTVPACGRCVSVVHRPDACPGPKPDLCGICGKALPLTDSARAPHQCTPRRAVCAGFHVTGDRRCKERYRAPPPKPSTPPSEGQAGHKKRKRSRPRKPRTSSSQESRQRAQPPATNTDPALRPGAVAIGPSRRGPSPDGPTAKKPNTGQAPPAPSKPNQASPQLKPAAQGDSSWAARVRKGSQDPSLHNLNIYSSPKLPNVTYADCLPKPLRWQAGQPLVIVGDFNAPSPHWGYQWLNIDETLGSDHCISSHCNSDASPYPSPLQAKLPDWDKFRSKYTTSAPIAQQGYATWSQHPVTSLRQTEQTVQLSEATPVVE
ncbi:hypothetical protein HPB48_004455 [Haemaphysalis longicornis]|uniref:Endonuclease/exonuclease/phosphatase domain-containing protein n=1 Tax=Haemaphysalis longicornis TaxID=44386 RepID=A0A9J6GWP1_HAELO|nr:hypothetical protein HPB48_004455 [Haemaphysalis longicornis]